MIIKRPEIRYFRSTFPIFMFMLICIAIILAYSSIHWTIIIFGIMFFVPIIICIKELSDVNSDNFDAISCQFHELDNELCKIKNKLNSIDIKLNKNDN